MKKEESPAERYDVESFDLTKKRLVCDAANPYMPSGVIPIDAFCAAVNALHFDGADGRLVSEEDAREVFVREMGVSYDPDHDLFDRFLSEQKNLIFGEE